MSDASRSALEEPFSLEKLREAWQRQLVGHRDIPASVLKVALAIGWHLNRDKGGVAWPGIRRLSELTSLVPSTVSWAVKWLEKHQHLHVERRRNGKRNLPNLYRPLLRKRHERQTDVEQGVPITIEQGVPIATSTEPSTEPLIQPHIPIRISAPTGVGALPRNDQGGNEGRGIRERKGSEADDSPTTRPEPLKSLRAECYRLAGEYDDGRGRALVTMALEEGADDQDVLDEIRAAIEAGNDLGEALSDFWKHSLG